LQVEAAMRASLEDALATERAHSRHLQSLLDDARRQLRAASAAPVTSGLTPDEAAAIRAAAEAAVGRERAAAALAVREVRCGAERAAQEDSAALTARLDDERRACQQQVAMVQARVLQAHLVVNSS
jgi:hypothetical protein